jgi:hypothetical protein
MAGQRAGFARHDEGARPRTARAGPPPIRRRDMNNLFDLDP